MSSKTLFAGAALAAVAAAAPVPQGTSVQVIAQPNGGAKDGDVWGLYGNGVNPWNNWGAANSEGLLNGPYNTVNVWGARPYSYGSNFYSNWGNNFRNWNDWRARAPQDTASLNLADSEFKVTKRSPQITTTITQPNNGGSLFGAGWGGYPNIFSGYNNWGSWNPFQSYQSYNPVVGTASLGFLPGGSSTTINGVSVDNSGFDSGFGYKRAEADAASAPAVESEFKVSKRSPQIVTTISQPNQGYGSWGSWNPFSLNTWGSNRNWGWNRPSYYRPSWNSWGSSYGYNPVVGTASLGFLPGGSTTTINGVSYDDNSWKARTEADAAAAAPAVDSTFKVEN